jgi:hypothetical protein
MSYVTAAWSLRQKTWRKCFNEAWHAVNHQLLLGKDEVSH